MIAMAHLRYRNELGKQRQLPEWAEFLGRQGSWLANRERSGSRVILAVALPTRAYAAVLVALGVTLEMARNPVHSTHLREHFEHLASLQHGTKVFFFANHKRHRAILLGLDDALGPDFIKVQLSSGDGTAYVVRHDHSSSIELGEWDGDLPEKHRGKKVSRKLEFVQAALRAHDANEFVTKSRLDALIVGSIGRLQDEVDTPMVAALSNGRAVPGSLRDLLRVKRLSPNAAYRTDIYSDIADIEDKAGIPESVVVIIDGSRPFINFRNQFKSNHCVVLLDRTSSGFLDAVSAINQDYMKQPAFDFDRATLEQGKPWGVEVMAFEERVE